MHEIRQHQNGFFYVWVLDSELGWTPLPTQHTRSQDAEYHMRQLRVSEHRGTVKLNTDVSAAQTIRDIFGPFGPR
jgi:hypothetical protein